MKTILILYCFILLNISCLHSQTELGLVLKVGAFRDFNVVDFDSGNALLDSGADGWFKFKTDRLGVVGLEALVNDKFYYGFAVSFHDYWSYTGVRYSFNGKNRKRESSAGVLFTSEFHLQFGYRYKLFNSRFSILPKIGLGYAHFPDIALEDKGYGGTSYGYFDENNALIPVFTDEYVITYAACQFLSLNQYTV